KLMSSGSTNFGSSSLPAGCGSSSISALKSTASAAGAGGWPTIWLAESASGGSSGSSAPKPDIVSPSGSGTGVTTGVSTGGRAAGPLSSAMICRMDDRISSIDGSLVAGLFMIAPSAERPPIARPLNPSVEAAVTLAVGTDSLPRHYTRRSLTGTCTQSRAGVFHQNLTNSSRMPPKCHPKTNGPELKPGPLEQGLGSLSGARWGAARAGSYGPPPRYPRLP